MPVGGGFFIFQVVVHGNSCGVSFREAESGRRNSTINGQSFDGFAAACVQHELDHLDGVVTFDHLSASDRAAKLAEYRDVP